MGLEVSECFLSPDIERLSYLTHIVCLYSCHGQVGVGHTRDVTVPTLVSHLDDERITSVACGGAHTLALTSSHMVYAWGLNQSGYTTNHTILPLLFWCCHCHCHCH
jgi:alpha-tubulin suppressor-like RCC1 family protein